MSGNGCTHPNAQIQREWINPKDNQVWVTIYCPSCGEMWDQKK